MKGVILQPSYIPWRGYFHQIQRSDVFVFYDDVQYDKHGWRNRNRVKTKSGTQWLTIPVHSSGAIVPGLEIRDVSIDWNRKWNRKHLATLTHAYSRAPYFGHYESLLQRLYSHEVEKLAEFTISSTIELARELGIEGTQFLRASSLGAEGRKTERLIDLLTKANVTHYISGPSARSYMDEAALGAAGISLEYMTYDYPEYEQLHPPFDPFVSVLDLLMMHGPEAGRWIWSDSESQLSAW